MVENIKHINNKKGFSLLEASIVMLIVAIFVAVMANVIPQKAKKKVASEAHGRFECFYKNGTLYQQTFTENSSSGLKTAASSGGDATTCNFQPPYYAKYLIIDAVGGGAGGASGLGGSEGKFVSMFYTNISNAYKISPGKGGAAGADGGDTIIKTGTSTLMTAKGGKSKVSLDNTEIDDVRSCIVTEYVTDDYYDCKTSPVCEIVDGKVRVSFCRTKDTYKTVDLTYKEKDSSGNVVKNNPRHIVNDIYTKRKAGTQNVWVYHDISLFSDYSDATNPVYASSWVPSVTNIWAPSLYTLELTMDIDVNDENASAATISNLERYINSMKYVSDITTVHPGMGGAAGSAGSDGAVILLW